MLNATQAKQVAPLTVAVPLLQARLGPKLQQAQPGPRRAEEQVVPQPVQNRLAGQTGVHRRVDPAPVAHRRQSTSADQVRLKSPCVHYLCRFAKHSYMQLESMHHCCLVGYGRRLAFFASCMQRSAARLCYPQLRCIVIVAKLMQQYGCCIFGVKHHRQHGISRRWQYP